MWWVDYGVGDLLKLFWSYALLIYVRQSCICTHITTEVVPVFASVCHRFHAPIRIGRLVLMLHEKAPFDLKWVNLQSRLLWLPFLVNWHTMYYIGCNNLRTISL